MPNRSLKFSAFLILLLLVASACGDQTTDATFNFSYDSNAATVIGDGSDVSVRAVYSFDNLYFEDTNGGARQRGYIVEPSSAAFNFETDDQNHISFKVHTAKDAGYNAQSGSFTLHSMALNHTGTFIGIDFLKRLSDGKYYVVAFGCLKFEEKLNKDLLKAATSSTLTIKRGRNCGACTNADYNDYGATVENAKNACP